MTLGIDGDIMTPTYFRNWDLPENKMKLTTEVRVICHELAEGQYFGIGLVERALDACGNQAKGWWTHLDAGRLFYSWVDQGFCQLRLEGVMAETGQRFNEVRARFVRAP